MPPDLLANVGAVLFDLDDTLLDYSAARDAAVVAWGERLRLSLGGQALVSLWAALESVHFARYVSGELTVQEQRRARVTGVPGLEGVDDSTADEHFREFLTLSEVLWRPLPENWWNSRANASCPPMPPATPTTCMRRCARWITPASA